MMMIPTIGKTPALTGFLHFDYYFILLYKPLTVEVFK